MAYRRAMASFVPTDFIIPTRLEHPDFILRPLRIGDVVKDYDAVMTSVDHLRGVFSPNDDWPRPDMSLEQDLVDLGWHHGEFDRRRSFAFTVMRPDEGLCLGCAYINPSQAAGYDAQAFCWIRASHAEALDLPLYEALKAWLAKDWPFANVAYPGRAIDWNAWEAAKAAG